MAHVSAWDPNIINYATLKIKLPAVSLLTKILNHSIISPNRLLNTSKDIHKNSYILEIVLKCLWVTYLGIALKYPGMEWESGQGRHESRLPMN